ncbi:MAG: histidine kinase, partial [Deltaproteobacteria bacterium]
MANEPTYEELARKIKDLDHKLLTAKTASQETEEAAKNHKRFLKFLPYPVIVRDAKGLVSYLNPAFTRTFGWTLAELKGKKGDQYVPGSLENELIGRLKALPAKKSVLQLSTIRLTKDGRTLDVKLRVGVDRDENNNPEGMIIVLRDVTMENRRKRNRSAMNRISRVLPQYPDLRKLLTYINTEIKELLGTESANTILLDETQKEFYFLSTANDDPHTRERIEKARFSVDELLSGQVVKTGIPMIVNDLSKNPDQYQSRDQKIGYTVKNALLVPLRNKDRIIGILAADNKKTGEFDDTDLETLETIAAT